MTYVPGCSADVFISYSHQDNLDNWVSTLKEELGARLSASLPGVEVWFDDRIRPGVYFQQEIQEKLKNTPIFVAVISPSYLQSDFCMRSELEWFQNQGGKDVIQLVKVPLDSENLDIPLPQAHYEKLYDESDQRELTGDRLKSVLPKVVSAVSARLRACRKARPTIFVAQNGDEAFKVGWDSLKQRLHEEGYAIVPPHVLIRRVPDRSIQNWIEEAHISVHLGGVQDDLPRRQLEIAKRTGKPLIVLEKPPHAEDVSVVVGKIHATLETHRSRAVYFIYDYHSDGPRVSALSQQISALTGFEVLTPEAGEKYHKYRLRMSDGVLLFQCEAPEEWLKAQEQALIQCVALRGDPAVPVAWYFTGHLAQAHPPHGQTGQLVIERPGDANVGDLQPFFEALRMRAGNELRQPL